MALGRAYGSIAASPGPGRPLHKVRPPLSRGLARGHQHRPVHSLHTEPGGVVRVAANGIAAPRGRAPHGRIMTSE